MRDEAFCWIGLTRGEAQLRELLSLLPEPRRKAIENLLGQLGGLKPADVRARWKQTREAEMDELSKRVTEKVGLELELMPPFLQEWICERARHG